MGAEWISAQDPTWQAQVTTLSPGPFRGYATALWTLPWGGASAGCLHVARLGQAAVDDVGRVGSRTSWDARATVVTRCIAAGDCCAAAS